MSYTVLARKYRPQSFADMVGQEHVIRIIESAIRSARIAHAYLFTGPRGVGKTTAARLLARSLNCERGMMISTCGVCRACIEIRDGTSVDVMEIDGASNNGVENVRELRENAKYFPQRDRYKISIIDEVHMLSQAAFNALLKLLEEPPPHVKFIFATTEPHKLPDTILSRCQRHNFRRIPAGDMQKQLQKIVALEKASIPDSALTLIIRQSDGGMRDALSLVDQIFSACGPSPSSAEIAEVLGAIDCATAHAFTCALVQRDAKLLMSHAENTWKLGVDLRRLAEDITFQLRHVFVTKATGTVPGELADSEKEAVQKLAAEADLAQLARMFDVMHSAQWDIARAPQPRLAFEMALLKGVYLAPAAAIPELITRVESFMEKTSNEMDAPGVLGGHSSAAPFRSSNTSGKH